MRFLAVIFVFLGLTVPAMSEPLASWNDTASRQRIMDFVASVTDETAETFIAPADRIATFDNDGCLWAEQPIYFQLLYAMDRLKEKAEQDPSILTSPALRAAADRDLEAALGSGEEGLIQIINASHKGVTVSEFQADVSDWLATATHPETGIPFGKMTYQPMIELLDYLRANEFQTFIVSGGGQDFIRAFAMNAYGIPPEQVVGSEGNLEYREGEILKTGDVFFIDDKAGKPVGIERHIGKRPIFAAGNSDGDFQMLEYTTAGAGPRFGMLIHHTDADREFSYDRDSHAGKLDRGLDEANARGWLVVDMKQDWSRIWSTAD